jgi:hypothetical protein
VSLRALVLLLVACGGAQRPAASSDPLARHLDWRGDLDALGVVVLAGDARLRGDPAQVELVAAPGGAFRETVSLGAVSLVNVSGPDGAFVVSLSGSIEPMPEHDRRAMERRLARLLGRGLGAGASSLAPLGRRERGGRAWDVVRIAHGPDAEELYLDPEDGALGWARVVEDTRTTWERFEWGVERGARVPRLEESFDEAGALVSRVAWTRVRAGLPPDPTAFARPQGRGLGIAVAGGEPARFELASDKILMRGRIAGVEASFLLDSGAGITVLDAALATRLGLPRLGTVTLAGTGARQQAPLVGPIAVSIAGVTVSGITAVAVDLAAVRDATGEEPPVILGKELFAGAIVDVDFPRQRIAFHDASTWRHDGRGVTLPVVPLANGLVAVEVSVEGRPPALFGLDTGGAGALDIFAGYAEETGLLAGRRTSARLGAGIGGAYQEKVARVASVTLAGATFRDVPVSFPEVKEGAFHTRRLAGNLGAALLSRFRVVFDLPHGKVHMEVGPGETDRPLARDRSGLSLEPDGRVAFVAPGSPAAAAGWKAGDRVVSVDGVPLAGAERRWGSRPAGTRVTLVDGAGRSRELVLADYY